MNPTEIEPKDIRTNVHFVGAFDNYEREITAYWIVRFCQERGGWHPFTYEEIDTWTQANGHRGRFLMNGIDKPEYRVIKDSGQYYPTAVFAWRCLQSVEQHEKYD